MKGMAPQLITTGTITIVLCVQFKTWPGGYPYLTEARKFTS